MRVATIVRLCAEIFFTTSPNYFGLKPVQETNINGGGNWPPLLYHNNCTCMALKNTTSTAVFIVFDFKIYTVLDALDNFNFVSVFYIFLLQIIQNVPRIRVYVRYCTVKNICRNHYNKCNNLWYAAWFCVCSYVQCLPMCHCFRTCNPYVCTHVRMHYTRVFYLHWVYVYKAVCNAHTIVLVFVHIYSMCMCISLCLYMYATVPFMYTSFHHAYMVYLCVYLYAILWLVGAVSVLPAFWIIP